MKKITLFFSILFFTSFSLRAQTIEKVFSPFQTILSKYLVETKLEAEGIVSAFRYQQAIKDSQVENLRKQQRNKLRKIKLDFITNKNQANAFWINAYNFFMIDYILAHQNNDKIVSSVKDYGSFFNPYKVFSKEFITISGAPYSLDKIEKSILLGDKFKKKGWFDSKIHFAVNCASVGCPPLRKEIYTANNLQELLKANTMMALRTSRHLFLKEGTLNLTHLFKWYKDDFERESGTVINFIKNYGPKNVTQKIDEKTNIEYIEYDWGLNRPSNFSDL